MKRLIILSCLLVSIVISSNYMAVKMFDIGPFTLPTAVICYPFCFAIANIINEYFGLKMTKRIIYIGFVMNALSILFLSLAAFMPASRFFGFDEGFRAVFLSAPRILVAGFVAYIVSGLLNSYVFNRFKKAGALLAVRSAIATFLGIVVDSFIFIFGAFAFSDGMTLVDILIMALAQTVAKLVFGIGLGTPMTLLTVKLLPPLSAKDKEYFEDAQPNEVTAETPDETSV